MPPLVKCVNKIYGKLITKEDANALFKQVEALKAGGMNEIAAEQKAVKDALEGAIESGRDILNQIQAQRPQAHQQALDFWNMETLRQAAAAGLPRFVTEGVTRAEVPGVPAPVTPEAPRAPAEAPPAAEAAPPAAEAPAPAEAPPPVAPPPVPVSPISDAAQIVVNSLPEEQRNEAQKAFAQDDRDVRADELRAKGQPVPKRKYKAVASEKNTGLINDLSRYGVFDKPIAEVVSNIANDPKAPRWIRLLANLFTQLGLGSENVSIRVVNTPKADWRGLYHFNRETGKGEILINLSHAAKPGDLARIILHELMHHGTLRKLTTSEDNLTPAELAAKRQLEKVFDYVKTRPEVFKGKAAEYGATQSLTEFVSEIFSNDKLRALLNSIKPDGKVSLLQRFTDAVLNMLVGDRFQIGMRKGSLLEAAIKEAIKVAGNPAVETSPDTTAAMQERNSNAARQANEHPNFQEEIANLIAPMANNMGISEKDLIARKLDHEAAFYTDDERAVVEAAVDARVSEINATPAEIAEVKKRIGDEVRYNRAYHPANSGWANKAIKVLGLEEKKGLTRGDPTKQNPSGIAFKIKYKDTPYTYAREGQTAEEAAAGKSGKPIQRFLKQGKPDKETGKPIDNPEWGKRVGQLANKMFDDLQGIMARRGKGDDNARVAQVIVDQINWYRDMRTRLRTEFGSMSDYVADVIAGFSPITDVPGNWNNFIDYFRHVMRGDYDEAFRKFDEYISADPENRSSGTYKKQFPPEKFPQLWPRKLLKEGQPLFGANTGNALMAGLDMWRGIKSGTAPKARNFGLNLIGQSLKATIDRWAGRYLQRMHAPTWRLPPSIEGNVTGGHMPGENVELVSGDFGMGQDVFEQVATRLREGGHEIFKEVTAADLQAILWFAEKEVWEMRKWTDIMGAGSSMNVVAQATAAQRYEAGAAPGKTSAKDEKLMGETIELRTNLNAEAHMLGAKMVPSVNIADGKESKTFDGEWITEPEYNPDNSVGHVAKIAARLGKKAAHISRVIVNPYEVNDQITPGLHIFFKGRVGDTEIKGVLDKLREAGITNGISLSVDPRVRPEIIKSLDPATGANQYNGVRVQFIYGTASGMTRSQIEEAFADANDMLAKDASVAESRVLHYDTLVLNKGTDYDTSGKLTEHFKNSRAKAWSERARNEGAAAAARRDDVQKAIADRKRQDLELESRMDREEQERIAAFAEFQRRVQPENRANDGGVDPPTVAAMAYQDESEPTRDPHGGRTSLVRSMVERIRNISRDKGGIEVPQSSQEVRGVAGAGGGANQGRKGSAPIWRNLGETFRKREASLYSQIDGAARLIASANPEDSENPKDPARYQNSQALLDYLSGKETPTDPELKSEITELRKEIPVIPQSQFKGLKHLDSGSEADVYHDPDSGVVYKFFNVNKNGGMEGSYVPGQIRLDRGGGIRIGMGERPTVQDFFSRMERANSHGAITPHELVAVTPEGQLVFAQPFVEGREVTQKNLPAALARAGVHFLSDLGATSGLAKLPDGRWVVYDDLHPGNVRTMPGGRVEIIDANNRELDSYEIADLTTLGKMPPEKPLAPTKPKATKKVQKYDNATVIAPMVETHHGTPHEWAPEKRVRLADGTVEWMDMDRPTPSGATVIERAPEGRVREDKVGTGETNAAFGWGVLYSAARRGLAEHYRDILTSEKGEGEWFLGGMPMSDYRSEIYEHLHRALNMVDTERWARYGLDEIENTIDEFRREADYREKRVAVRVTDPSVHRQVARDYRAMADALERYKDQLVYRKGGGNVYTVQLDVDDPELLDWFMPMKDQMFVWDKVAARFNVTRESAKEAWEENDRLATIAENLETYSRELRDNPDSERTPGLEEEINKEHEAALERWNKHYKQAPTQLGQILAAIGRDPGQSWGIPYTGQKFYEFMTQLMNNSPKAASKYLDLSGVPGIVFIDRESRKETAEQKFNNYVVFDPERIKVVAKNGEVVRTVADDLPAPPEPNVVEPVTIAASAARDVKDNTDLTIAPMAGRGERARYPWTSLFHRPETVEGYRPGGLWTPHAQLSKEVGNFAQERERSEKAVAYRAEADVQNFERALKAGYGKQGPDKTQHRDVQEFFGNLDNRLTEEQYNESLKIKNPAERRSFEETAFRENINDALARQQAAATRLPAIVLKYATKLRNRIDDEGRKFLKDTGIDPELRARITSPSSPSELSKVFLHADSYQHFESDVWGKHIKSDDPEAQRIRRNAETLFKNEIIAEKAHEYQVAHPGTTDADALAYAKLLPNIDQMAKNRLAAYLNKNANEATRMQLLTGKMPIYRVPESGKLLSLNRENIPQEVKELWGQWTDPKINFVKTYTLLANHNADLRMQHSIVEDGTRPETGYIWKRDPADPSSSPPAGLVALGRAGDVGPLADAYGPQWLKDGLANVNNPEVQDMLMQINRWSLMSKTVGNIASAVHNFFGNVAFSIANGNLLWAATMAPKTLISSAFGSFVTTYGRATGTGSQATQDEIAEMIDLGVFDSDIAIGTIKAMARAAQAGIVVEKKLGPAAGLQAVGRVLKTGASKTGGAFKQLYQAADNWWKYFNYRIELAKQQWFYSGEANPPSLEEMKREAANQVMNTLLSYSRVPELVRRGLSETPLKYTGAFFTFQTESARTAKNNITTTWVEATEGNAKQKVFAGYRTAGMLAMLYMPYLFTSLSKWMFGYDDDDEEALRNSLPEYQKNASLLFMLPKDEKRNPRYFDVSFLNPYGLFHSSYIAGRRAYHEGRNVPAAVGEAAFQVVHPLMTVQPGIGTLMDLALNKDSTRGGRQIYNPEDTFTNKAIDVGWRAARGVAPGTALNIEKAYESFRGIKDTSGREPDPLQDITAGLAGAPRLNTLELERAMAAHVNTYGNRMGDATRLLKSAAGTKATVAEGEVADAYRQANAQAQEIFTDMNKAYRQMLKLGMDEDAAYDAMERGFGDEILKSGLSKKKIGDIIDGIFPPIELSDKMRESIEEYHPERLEEYEKALEEAQETYDLQDSR